MARVAQDICTLHCQPAARPPEEGGSTGGLLRARCLQLVQGSVPGPSFFEVWLLKCQPLSVPWTEPYKLQLLWARGKSSHEVCLFPQKAQGTRWAGNTFYLATCIRGRRTALFPAGGRGRNVVRQGGEVLGMAVPRVGWALGMLSKPQSAWPRHGGGQVVLEPPPHPTHPGLTHPSSQGPTLPLTCPGLPCAGFQGDILDSPALT